LHSKRCNCFCKCLFIKPSPAFVKPYHGSHGCKATHSSSIASVYDSFWQTICCPPEGQCVSLVCRHHLYASGCIPLSRKSGNMRLRLASAASTRPAQHTGIQMLGADHAANQSSVRRVSDSSPARRAMRWLVKPLQTSNFRVKSHWPGQNHVTKLGALAPTPCGWHNDAQHSIVVVFLKALTPVVLAWFKHVRQCKCCTYRTACTARSAR
jgi:hypothetical protein